jgi:hypothetical protein
VADGQTSGTCAHGCQGNDDCCLGQRCDATSGQCLQSRGTLKGSTAIALCDAASCQGSSTACTGAGGSCEAAFDQDFGCVPSCMQDSDCAKGFGCSKALQETATNGCTFGGNQCHGGRTCSASAEVPKGICSCLGDSECDSSSTCVMYGNGSFCTTKAGACGSLYECAELRSGQELVCNDLF